MAKNILILSASPRRNGNSDTLCNEFARGANESGNNVEKIFLADKKIGFCKGCCACNSTHKCIQKDDMADILEKMLKADVIVFGTPIYFYTINGQLKTFIDRCVSKYTEINNKDYYFIMTAADNRKETLEPAVVELKAFLDCMHGSDLKGIIYGTAVWKFGEILDSKAIVDAFEMGKSIK